MSELFPVSVIITTFNEGEYLDRILEDLAAQDCSGLDLEILLLEAGQYPVERARKHLGPLAERLVFVCAPSLPRTCALNTLIRQARGDLIVRLDARSHIAPDYLRRVSELSQRTGADNVGGVQVPVGLTQEQALIAKVMTSPFALGGAKFRRSSYQGDADSVYLGAFNANKIAFDAWFDEDHPLISEDSDLNFRIRQAGGRVHIDSSILVEHYPRETLRRFFRLCYNYGVGRGLFVIKHRTFSAVRQLVLPAAALAALLLLAAGFAVPFLHALLATGLAIYALLLLWGATTVTSEARNIPKVFCALAGCHVFWTLGLVLSPLQYRRDKAAGPQGLATGPQPSRPG
jgi:succinoglycan biosynthesis protein ExoA